MKSHVHKIRTHKFIILIKALATPSSYRRCQSATSTPLQPIKAEKLRQKLFFQPLSSSGKAVPSNVVCDEEKWEEPEVVEKEAIEHDEVGVATDTMWAELQTLQECNNDLRRQLEVSLSQL